MAAKPIIVVGGGGHGKVLMHVLSRLPQYHLLGYVDPRNGGPVLGFPHLGEDEQLPMLLKKNPGLSAALGVGKVVAVSSRLVLLDHLRALGYALPPIVAPTAMVARSVMLGEGTVVMDGAVIQPDCVLGRGCIVNTRAVLDHDCLLADDVHVASGAVLSGEVKINDGCLVGVGASVIQGVRITKGCLIGAGAAVTDHCAESGTYVGVPAKKVSA